MPAARGLDANTARRIAVRSLRLILIGVLLTNIYWLADYDAYHFRWLGVLQRIGLVFAVVAPLHLLLSTRQIVWTAIAALLGYSLLCVLPLPDGTLNVRIPAGAQSGKQLRVRGRGLPSSPPGDLMLEIQVVLPEASSAKARELYETMSRELAFNPRETER